MKTKKDKQLDIFTVSIDGCKKPKEKEGSVERFEEWMRQEDIRLGRKI